MSELLLFCAFNYILKRLIFFKKEVFCSVLEKLSLRQMATCVDGGWVREDVGACGASLSSGVTAAALTKWVCEQKPSGPERQRERDREHFS